MENYVTLSLEKYNELNEKAKKFDELKERLGEDAEGKIKNAINGLVECLENIATDIKENQETEEKEGNKDE